MNQSGFDQLCGRVAAVIYQNGENGYTVIKLDCSDGAQTTVVGCIPFCAPGEELMLTGTWTRHATHGAQFKAERIERRLPDNERGIYDYLASGVLRGIGPSTAALIVKRFGNKSLNVIGEDPIRLSSVKGISEKRALDIGREFQRKAGLRRLIEFLSQFSLSAQLAVKLYKCYGDSAENIVRLNPYIIVSEFFGQEFSSADNLAINLGIESDAPERLEAALLFELRHNLTNGHCFIPEEKLLSAASGLIGISAESLEDALESLKTSGEIICEEIAGVKACYLESLFMAEAFIARRVSAMTETTLNSDVNTDVLIKAIEKQQGITYASAQKHAVETAATEQIMILTGGPGTGKTTTVRAIIAAFDNLGLETVLCAPTGRAAKRMSELCLREASTVHKLLGAAYEPEGEELIFQKCESDPLDADAVILDESSMADIPLIDALLDAMKPECRLVLVGDADQLPPVGPGSPFSDMIRSGAVEIVMLTEIFRQAEESGIVKNAHRINRGEVPDLKNGSKDFFFMKRTGDEQIADTIKDLVCRRLPENMGIDPSQIQVLSPHRQKLSGTLSLNRILQEALNPARKGINEIRFGGFVFREGDRVMQIRNNYDIIWQKKGTEVGTGIFNGDIGRILEINNAAETATIDFDEKISIYSYDMLSEIEPAYAMTVHKSQGSEYRCVVLAAGNGYSRLMTRSILYTAITRAKDFLVIVGDDTVVEAMTLNDRRQKRYSGLKARLQK